MTYKNTFKSIALGAGLLLFAAACNQQPPAVQTNPQVPQNPPAQNPTNPEMTNQTYTNSSYNFSFDYGNDFTFVTPAYGSLKNQIVQVQMSNANYPKTNFDDADFTVSQDYAANQAACLKFQANSGSASGFNNQQTINGVNFYSEKGGDAAAGNLYNSMIYRTYRGTDCIELDETIHTGNIGNYPTGTVTEINQAPIQAELDSILNSFKFTK